jgi:ribonuclease P protein component
MLPKKRRIPRALFPTAMKGKVFFSPYYSARVKKLPEGRNSLYSVVVSRKVDPRATVRNRIKRRVYAVAASSPLPKPYSVVFFMKKEASTVPFKTLEADIKAFFGKIISL